MFNPTDDDVDLHNWRLTGVGFEFSTSGANIDARERIILVPIEPSEYIAANPSQWNQDIGKK